MSKKTSFYMVALSLAMMLCVGLTSCNKDDDNDNNNSSTPPASTGKAPENAVAVDLGLPSGTKWANMNVGATTPEGYGGYFAWGETEDKATYSWGTYQYSKDGTKNDLVHIGVEIVGTKYDAAYMKWGGNWRMPTKEQIMELLEKCSKEWATLNGIGGVLLKGPNGKTIFLPAAGEKKESLSGQGTSGDYWSGSNKTTEFEDSYQLSFHHYTSPEESITTSCTDGGRYRGKSIRAVMK